MILHTEPYTSFSEHEENSENKLVTSSLLSLLFHVLILFLLGTVYRQPKLAEKVVKVSFISEKPKIAPPSDSPEEKPDPKNMVMLSDKDTKSLDPQIRKGDVPTPSSAKAVETARQSSRSLKSEDKSNGKNDEQTSSQLASKGTVPKDIQLRLDPNSLRKFEDPSSAVPTNPQNSPRSLSDYQPFSRNTSPSLRLGSPDFLPDIKDGEMTLLNAKADTYAVFVRRVALKVFSELRRTSWSNLSFQSARRLSRFSEVEAIMSPEGSLLQVRLRDSSGVSQFDSLLVSSSKTGTWDQNPPPGAKAADGNIHFIFKAKTWAQRGGDRTNERRWLLLSTGLL